MRDLIKKIIQSEFKVSIENIENDIKKNYQKKIHNFLLNQFDEETIANMVFVSSFESKSGNAIQKVARKIAQLKFGEENVPLIINPHNLQHNIDENSLSEQVIITNVNISGNNGSLHGGIKNFMSLRQAQGRGFDRKESSVDQTTIKELLSLSNDNISTTIHTKPVDLAFFDKGFWHLMEIKAGGDLDSSNAPSNITKLLTLYVSLNYENTKLYFSTIYNKNGEGKNWTGIAKNYLNFPSMFLIGSKFWETILPDEISFSDFVILYKDSLTELDINNRIHGLIKSCV